MRALHRAAAAAVLGAVLAAVLKAQDGAGVAPGPAPNLLTNPGVETGAGGKPDGWSFHTATPAIFEADWRDAGRSGKCLWLKAASGEMSGYWSQTVSVVPGKTYLATGFLRLVRGKVLCYVHGTGALPDGRRVSLDERFYRGTMRGHWLSPVFLPPEALSGPDPDAWLPFQIRFTVPPPVERVTLSLGLYFAAGEAAFDDLSIVPVEAETPQEGPR